MINSYAKYKFDLKDYGQIKWIWRIIIIDIYSFLSLSLFLFSSPIAISIELSRKYTHASNSINAIEYGAIEIDDI